MNEDQPLGLALKPFARHAPWAEEEPLVRRFETDTPKESRCAKALEQCTVRALQAWEGRP